MWATENVNMLFDSIATDLRVPPAEHGLIAEDTSRALWKTPEHCSWASLILHKSSIHKCKTQKAGDMLMGM